MQALMRANAPACLTDGDNRLADGVRQLDLFFPFGVEEEGSLQVLWEDGERRAEEDVEGGDLPIAGDDDVEARVPGRLPDRPGARPTSS
jgi:hypothetical protein